MVRQGRGPRLGVAFTSMALLAFLGCAGCGSGGAATSKGAGTRGVGWWYDSGSATVSASPFTAADTNEAAGATDVPLLGMILANPFDSDLVLSSITIHGEGDLSILRSVRLVHDIDGNEAFSPGDVELSSGNFSGGSLSAGVSLRVMPRSTQSLLLLAAMDPAAADGLSVRARTSADAGDLQFSRLPGQALVRGDAVSGWKTIGGPVSLALSPAMPARGPFADAGETGVPVVAARLRASSAGDAQAVTIGADGWGADAGWDRLEWTAWLDRDADGALSPAIDTPLGAPFALSPAGPTTTVALPDAILAGTSERLLLSADLHADAPNGLFAASLHVAAATDAASGGAAALAGVPAESGVRIGTTGTVVAAGRGLEVLDPVFGAPLAVMLGSSFSGPATVDPNGRWAAMAFG